MVRKIGSDIRNGNWLFYNDKLLGTPRSITKETDSSIIVVSPDELADILEQSTDIIFTAMEALHRKTQATSAEPEKPTRYGKLFMTKMVPAGIGQARGTGLTELAFDRRLSESEYNNPNDFTPEDRPYFEAVTALGYSAQLLINLGDWNAVRDGGWLQGQRPDQI